jgi:hypothetical protein
MLKCLVQYSNTPPPYEMYEKFEDSKRKSIYNTMLE